MLGSVKRAIVLTSAILVVLMVYLAIRRSDPGACPGLQALDPTCIAIRD
jgi:hypothetical protein